MSTPFTPRCPSPRELVVPVPVDRDGLSGPTAGQARGPRWRRSSPRLYVPVSAPQVVEQRILEQSMRLPANGAVGGWAALRMAGAAYFDGRDRRGGVVPVPLMVPTGANLKATPDARVARVQLPPGDLVLRHGIRCVEPRRALLDCVRGMPLREAVVCIDMAVAAGLFGIADLAAYARARTSWSRTRRFLSALEHADGRALSPEEVHLRLVWRFDAGLPRPLCNWPVADASGRRIGRPDLLCAELGVVGEYDGAEHRSRRRHAVDVAREEDFRNVGLECFRVVGPDRFDLAKVVARMHSAVERARASTRPATWRLLEDPGPP